MGRPVFSDMRSRPDRVGADMDDDRLEGPPDSTTLSKLSSVLGDSMGLPLRPLDFQRGMLGKRAPMRDVRPAKGDSLPDLFLRDRSSTGMSPSLKKPIS